MRLSLGLGLVLSLAFTSVASADIPLPGNLKYIDPRVQFEGIDQLPDHVVYLRFLTFTGGPGGVPHRLMPVKDSKPFALNAQRRLFDMSLVALDRKEFEKRAKEDPTLAWLTDKTEGALVAKIQAPPTTGPALLKEAPVSTYRVQLKDGKLSAEMVKAEKSGQANPSGLLPLWAVGILSATGFAWFGVWMARRR